jgi:hypothetical protein
MAVETPERTEGQAPAQVEAPRTVEVIDAELRAYGQRIAEAYTKGDHGQAMQLQADAGKLYKEMQSLESRAAAQRVMAEIGPATYEVVRPAVMRALQSAEFKAQAEKAAANGFRTYQVTITMATKEQLEADANAAPGLDAKWVGGAGASAPRRMSASGTGQGVAQAKAVVVDGERFPSRASLVDRFGSDHEKQLPDSYKSGAAKTILTRLEKEGHTVVVE